MNIESKYGEVKANGVIDIWNFIDKIATESPEMPIAPYLRTHVIQIIRSVMSRYNIDYIDLEVTRPTWDEIQIIGYHTDRTLVFIVASIYNDGDLGTFSHTEKKFESFHYNKNGVFVKGDEYQTN